MRALRRSADTGQTVASSEIVTCRPSIETSDGSPSSTSATVESTPSGPASAWTTGHRSSARRASGPIPSSRDPISPFGAGKWPVWGTRLPVGLWPNTPLKKAGMRIEPPKSVPIPNGAKPDPIAAPSPPEEPPAVRRRS